MNEFVCYLTVKYCDGLCLFMRIKYSGFGDAQIVACEFAMILLIAGGSNQCKRP